MNPQISRRKRKLRRMLKEQGLDAFVVFDRYNTSYFTDFPCSNSITLIGPREAIFLTDSRYLERARTTLTGYDIWAMAQDGMEDLARALRAVNPAVIGFEGTVPYEFYRKLRRAAGRRKMLEKGQELMALRAVKDREEIETVARNQRVNERVYASVLQTVEIGMSEVAVRAALRNGFNAALGEEAFEPIVATGESSAFPHAVSGPRRIRSGDLLLIDTGFKRNLYHSDMTRTVCVHSADARQKEIYDVVLTAQKAAVNAVRPGASCSDVDAVARSIIRDAGYGNYFGHGLGHGVGLAIHEGPYLNPTSRDVLAEGMVVTVEPGIYLPGLGGVRIEDLLVVTSSGNRNLTSAAKGLRTIC